MCVRYFFFSILLQPARRINCQWSDDWPTTVNRPGLNFYCRSRVLPYKQYTVFTSISKLKPYVTYTRWKRIQFSYLFSSLINELNLNFSKTGVNLMVYTFSVDDEIIRQMRGEDTVSCWSGNVSSETRPSSRNSIIHATHWKLPRLVSRGGMPVVFRSRCWQVLARMLALSFIYPDTCRWKCAVCWNGCTVPPKWQPCPASFLVYWNSSQLHPSGQGDLLGTFSLNSKEFRKNELSDITNSCTKESLAIKDWSTTSVVLSNGRITKTNHRS